MKADIHPQYFHDAVVTCSCGNSFTTGSTAQTIRTEVCNVCHPFFTGQQRIIDTGGQVERFRRRAQKAQQ
jgi:large subunit ribosomal protein L31